MEGNPNKEISFDPVEFINKTYTESTYYELNESLSLLSKSIARTQHESKTLIAEHFSKFIECRAVMEEIWNDVNSKGLDKKLTNRIEKEYSALLKKYDAIFGYVSEDASRTVLKSKKAYYLNEYGSIFSLKENLSQYTSSFQTFSRIYNQAKKTASKVSASKFIQRCLADAQPIVNSVLEKLYKLISENSTSFEDACYYFDLYFSIKGGKNERKIMNTLLVNFKETVSSKVSEGIGSLKYLLHILEKLLFHVDTDIGISAIEFFATEVDSIFLTLDLYSSRFALQEVKDLYIKISKNTRNMEILRQFKEKFSELSMKVFRRQLSLHPCTTFAKILETFSIFFDDSEMNTAKDAIVEETISIIENTKRSDCDYLNFESGEVVSVQNLLGSSNSLHQRKLRRYLREKRGQAILSISERCRKILENGTYSKGLLECARVISKVPKHYKQIFMEIRPTIEANPVIFYYLARLINMEQKPIEKEYASDIDRLRPQFGVLLEMPNKKGT